jgi:hypothetical protein
MMLILLVAYVVCTLSVFSLEKKVLVAAQEERFRVLEEDVRAVERDKVTLLKGCANADRIIALRTRLVNCLYNHCNTSVCAMCQEH